MTSRRALLVVLLAACAPTVSQRVSPPVADASISHTIGEAHPGASTPLSRQDSAWVETVLASLSPRERAAQLVMPWVPGEYSAVGSPEYEQVRAWVEDDKVGGLVLSMSAYPSVPAYLLAWGGAPVSQRAAAAALLGRITIGGRLPISIPPWFKTGDGLDRTASASVPAR